MNRNTFAIVTSIAMFQLIGITNDALATYWVNDGSSIIELVRDDEQLHSPWHEIGQGSYGYWVTTSQWQQVLDFSQTNPLISPFTWTNIFWIPGPMDWNSDTYLTLPESTQFIDIASYDPIQHAVDDVVASLDSPQNTDESRPYLPKHFYIA